ncbi:MAG TPA: hypothetical protein VMT89_15965 [Candidatus Acidoferrales bacterium]|nr:hypothetical protein [Candidatus Acidoferrales bacterium]
MTKRFVPTVLGIAVALSAFAWLSHVLPPFVATDDAIRDQLLARDCVELGRCHLIGAPTSLHGFDQGAYWIDLLVATRLFGANTSTQRTVVVALLALGVGTVFVVVGRWLRGSLALPAAVLLTLALGIDGYPALLINPSASSFFDVVAAAGLLVYGLSAQRRFLILASFALGVAINVHIGSLSLLPPLLAIAGLIRPRRDVPYAAGMILFVYFVSSRAALRANLIGLSGRGLAMALAGGVFTLLVAGGFGQRFRRLSSTARAWAIGWIIVSPFCVAASWFVFFQKHGFGGSYLHPIVGPAAVLVAAMVSVPFEAAAKYGAGWRWLPSIAALAALPLSARAPIPPPSVWSMAEARALVHAAARHGWSYEDLVFRLQSNDCRGLVTQMSAFAPPPTTTTDHGRRTLQALKARRSVAATLARPGEVTVLPSGEVLIVRQIESWLRFESLRVCRLPTASGAPQCESANLGAIEITDPQRFSFAMRSFPEIHRLDLPPPYVVRYEVPIAPRAGERRELILADASTPDCGWRITAADGVRVDDHIPARVVHLYSEEGAPGELIFERPVGTAACPFSDYDPRYPPCVLETQPGDALAPLLEGR